MRTVLGIRTIVAVLALLASVCKYNNTDGDVKYFCGCTLCIVCTLVLYTVPDISSGCGGEWSTFTCSILPPIASVYLLCVGVFGSIEFSRILFNRPIFCGHGRLCCLTERSVGVNIAGFLYRPTTCPMLNQQCQSTSRLAAYCSNELVKYCILWILTARSCHLVTFLQVTVTFCTFLSADVIVTALSLFLHSLMKFRCTMALSIALDLKTHRI